MVKIIVFLIMCFFIYYANPVPEADPCRPSFENAIESLKNIDIAEQLTKMFFKCPEQASTNVIKLMNTKHNPKVSDVLDAFNEAFDVKLFIILDDNIQLDIKAFEMVLCKNYQEFFDPFDLNQIKQPEEAFKQEIKVVSDAVREAENKLPVERLVATLEAQSRATGIRERWTFIDTKCGYFLDSATENIRNNLREASQALTALPFAENQIVDSFVGFLKEFLSWADEIVSITSNVCDSGATRKRVNRFVTTRGVVSIIEDFMDLISSSMNTILMSILDSIYSAVQNVFENILDVIVYLQDLVRVVYPCTFCQT